MLTGYQRFVAVGSSVGYHQIEGKNEKRMK